MEYESRSLVWGTSMKLLVWNFLVWNMEYTDTGVPYTVRKEIFTSKKIDEFDKLVSFVKCL